MPYWTNVTAFDFGSPKSGLASLETSKTVGPVEAYPFNSESEANDFIEKNKKAFGKEERWIHEDWKTDKLADRIIDERTINPIPLMEKVKAFFTRMDNPNSYTEYLIKKDYTVKTKNITAEIESIELKKVKEKEKVENIKKIDIDNMTDDELKLIIKQLIKKI